MPRTHKVHRVDANQDDIVQALEALGASVKPFGSGLGAPDLIVGYKNKNFLLEVKTDKGTLNPDQTMWHLAWKGQVNVVRSPEEAVILVTGKKLRKGK